MLNIWCRSFSHQHHNWIPSEPVISWSGISLIEFSQVIVHELLKDDIPKNLPNGVINIVCVLYNKVQHLSDVSKFTFYRKYLNYPLYSKPVNLTLQINLQDRILLHQCHWYETIFWLHRYWIPSVEWMWTQLPVLSHGWLPTTLNLKVSCLLNCIN